MPTVCDCAANWRVELADLVTGEVVETVIPMSFEFERRFLSHGRGSIMFHRRQVVPEHPAGLTDPYELEDFYTGSRGIFFQRLRVGSAETIGPVGMFGGLVSRFDMSGDGIITLGFDEMTEYFNHRIVRTDLQFTGVQQTVIADQLIEYTKGTNVSGGSTDPDANAANSLNVTSITPAPASTVFRDRTYLAKDRPIVGDLIQNLANTQNGVVYEVSYVRTGAGWSTQYQFRDNVFQPDVKTVQWPDVVDATLSLDRNGMANHIDGFGADDGSGDPIEASFGLQNLGRPRFDATVTHSTVSDMTTLQDNVEGYWEEHEDARGVVDLQFAGLDWYNLDIDDVVPGHEVNLAIRSPNLGVVLDSEAGARIRFGSVTVRVPNEGLEQVNAAVVIESPSTLILAQDNFLLDCVDC